MGFLHERLGITSIVGRDGTCIPVQLGCREKKIASSMGKEKLMEAPHNLLSKPIFLPIKMGISRPYLLYHQQQRKRGNQSNTSIALLLLYSIIGRQRSFCDTSFLRM